MRRVLMTSDAVGGVWTYAVELIRALGVYEIEVLLAVMGPAPSDTQLADISRLENAHLSCGPFALEWDDEPWEDVDAASEWLLALAADFHPDVIHLNGYCHASLPWGAPVLIAAHSCVSTWWRHVHHTSVPDRYAEYRRRVRAGLQAAQAVVFPSAAFAREMMQEYDLNVNGVVIYNGRQSMAPTGNGKDAIILTAGRTWDAAKNVDLLTRIAPHLEWPISIAGGSAGGHTDVNVTHLGTLSASEMARACERASVYASPARYEPFGLAVLEAALAGCALVLSDLDTFRELWQDSAIYVPVDDEAAWVAALNSLARDEGLRLEMQRRARRRAQKFTPDVQARKYRTVYESILSPSEAALPCIA